MTPSGSERRKRQRRSCSLYLQFLNSRTGQVIGTLADISSGGFQLESTRPIPLQSEFVFRVDVPRDISSRLCITLVARSRWSRLDPFDARLYNTGFEIVSMDAVDRCAVERIMERYGSDPLGVELRMSYLWSR